MEIDTLLMSRPDEVRERAEALAATGVSGLFTVEGPHDVFLPHALASGLDLVLYTNVAIAFPRSPAHLAHTAWDLMALNDAGFALGLGTQVRAHIERRYGSTWSKPAARMAEWIEAIRAFWAAWDDDEPLAFRGEHTQHTLTTPAFDPGPTGRDKPPIWLGALGPRMTEVALTVADGLLVHPFSSDRHMAEATLPQVERVLTAAGRPREEVTLVGEGIVSCGRDAGEQRDADEGARWLVGFYGSTPAYEPVLATEGRADLHPELRRLSREGRWDEMAALVDDDLLDAIVLRGDPDTVAARIRGRFGDAVDRVGLYAPGGIADEALAAIVTAVRST